MLTSDPSSSSSTLPTLTVKGTSREMGRQYGEHFRDLIQRFVDMRFASAQIYFQNWGRGDVDQLKEMGRHCFEFAHSFHPQGIEEHYGIAEGAEVDPHLLYAATNMTDVRDVVLLPKTPPPQEDEGCTSLLVPSEMSSIKGGLYGQTWDLNPPDIEYIVALHRLPENEPETWSITCAGCLTLVGMNQYGLSVGTTNLKTWRSEVGVGYLSVLHKAVNQTTLKGIQDVLKTAPVAGAHSYWVGSVEGGWEWERSPHQAFMRNTVSGPLGRSNHCLFDFHQRHEGVEPTESSTSRFQRVNQLLQQGEHTLESIQKIFANREDGIYSINRYPEDEQGTTTNAVVITVPHQHTFYACKGPADRGQWHTFTFDHPIK